MKHVLLILLLPLHVFAQGEPRSTSSPLNVRIQKKAAQGELLVTATDEGPAKNPLRLVARAKCGPGGKWKTLDPRHEAIPERICFMQAEQAGDWKEGLQTLTIKYFVRVDGTGEFGPCEDKRETEIDLREVCAPN